MESLKLNFIKNKSHHQINLIESELWKIGEAISSYAKQSHIDTLVTRLHFEMCLETRYSDNKKSRFHFFKKCIFNDW